MSGLLLDTQTLIWMLGKPKQIGRKSARLLEKAHSNGELLVSAISFWEAGNVLKSEGYGTLGSLPEWRQSVLASGIVEITLDGAMALRAHELLGAHPDPFDRFILATAEARKAHLMTSDHVLLKWRGPVKCIDTHE